MLNRRLDLHAIDATPARWRGGAGSSPLDRISTAASSPRNDLLKNCRVHTTHWLISTQALIMLLLEHMARHGLTVGVLDPLLFPQGQIFHRKKAIMQSFVDGTERPYVFHMCWTAGRTDKLRYLKNMALWFLEPKCDQDSWKGHRDHGNSTFDHNQANCCLAGATPWTVPTPYTQVIDLKSK